MGNKPDSPSAQVSRTSPNVGAMTAHLVLRCVIACQAIHSAAVLVLPAPRPARYNQVVQLSASGNCSGLAISASHVARREAS